MTKVKDFLSRAFLDLAFEIDKEVVAVEVDFPVFAIGLTPFFQLLRFRSSLGLHRPGVGRQTASRVGTLLRPKRRCQPAANRGPQGHLSPGLSARDGSRGRHHSASICFGIVHPNGDQHLPDGTSSLRRGRALAPDGLSVRLRRRWRPCDRHQRLTAPCLDSVRGSRRLERRCGASSSQPPAPAATGRSGDCRQKSVVRGDWRG